MKRFTFARNPQAAAIGDTVESFLEAGGRPMCLFQDGRDSSRTRAFVTLLHGNEPSGAIALHRWLRSGERPAVNGVYIVASVAAALEPPRFSHRMLPRARDLNRCFKPPFEDAQGALAEEILEILHLHSPESVVDMHNTSGSGPAFGVCTFADRHHSRLVSLFSNRLIISNLRLGALMDISEHSYPTVTVEVGGRQDDAAHELAFDGLCRYLRSEQVLDSDKGARPAPDMEVFVDPVRLELKSHVTLTYGDAPEPAYDLTLRSDIEHLNFGTVNEHTPLGWTGQSPGAVFSAVDAAGHCAVSRLVREEDGVLYAAQPLKLFMITNNPDIAFTDCLLYAVAPNGQSLPK